MSDALSREEVQKTIDELKKEHAELDAKIIEMDEQKWLSPEEQLERKTAQKLKLKLKDRIHQLSEELDKES